MNEQEIKNILSSQRKYFSTGSTLNVNTRIAALTKLKDSIITFVDTVKEWQK